MSVLGIPAYVVGVPSGLIAFVVVAVILWIVQQAHTAPYTDRSDADYYTGRELRMGAPGWDAEAEKRGFRL